MYDAPIHYVVLNNGQNVFNHDSLDKMEKIYETIEESKGPGVVVTIGTGNKFFCTGFDLQWWLQGPKNQISSISRG